MQSLENSLKESFHRNKQSLEIIQESMQKDVEQLAIFRAKVIGKKAEKPDATHKDVKDDLLGAKNTTYLLTIKEQELRRYMVAVAELYLLSMVNKVDLELSEEDKKNMEGLLNNIKSLFAIDINQRTVTIADTTGMDQMLAEARKMSETDASMEAIFNSPYFTKQ